MTKTLLVIVILGLLIGGIAYWQKIHPGFLMGPAPSASVSASPVAPQPVLLKAVISGIDGDTLSLKVEVQTKDNGDTFINYLDKKGTLSATTKVLKTKTGAQQSFVPGVRTDLKAGQTVYIEVISGQEKDLQFPLQAVYIIK